MQYSEARHELDRIRTALALVDHYGCTVHHISVRKDLTRLQEMVGTNLPQYPLEPKSLINAWLIKLNELLPPEAGFPRTARSGITIASITLDEYLEFAPADFQNPIQQPEQDPELQDNPMFGMF